VWHTVDLFPPTIHFLREYLYHHRPKAVDNPYLAPTIKVVAGDDVDMAQRKSDLVLATTRYAALIDKAGIGEKSKRPDGTTFRTATFHTLRITNNNALKQANIDTKWITWRMCQSTVQVNAVYDRATPDNIKKVVFGKLGQLVSEDDKKQAELEKIGSMSLEDLFEVINHARRKLEGIRHGYAQPKASKQLSVFGGEV
jgi:hypothetical protein